jgi:hypothetical protein
MVIKDIRRLVIIKYFSSYLDIYFIKQVMINGERAYAMTYIMCPAASLLKNTGVVV